MGRAVGFIIFFFLIIVGVLIFLYFSVEKPKQEIVNEFTNLTIFIQDQDKNFIKTGYNLYMNDILYDNGLTNQYGGVFQTAITNRTYSLKNKNIGNQTYYIAQLQFNTYNITEPLRIILPINERGIINITQNGTFVTDKNINLTLTTNKSFENLIFCLRWSNLLIFVQSEVGERIDKIGNNDKCYSTDYTINRSNSFTIPISYDYINQISNNDFIRLTFYDTEQGNVTERQTYEIKKY